METGYRRATFVDPVPGERLTCTVDLLHTDGARTVHGPEPGIRPVTMSQYCVGIALLNPELPANKWSRLLRRTVGGGPAPSPTA